jgi:CobQ-like glutamine amidotransferase family enzyme
MIKLFSFEPHYFNNNGDQGNLEVIKHLLTEQKVKFKITSTIEEADFVLIGDASQAVMEEYSKQLGKFRKHIAARHRKGLPTLLVGSAYEFFAETLELDFQRQPRESKFVKTQDEYFGYRNSDNSLPICHVKDAFVATSLFGPVLIKNPALLEKVLVALGVKMALPKAVNELIETIRSQNG